MPANRMVIKENPRRSDALRVDAPWPFFRLRSKLRSLSLEETSNVFNMSAAQSGMQMYGQFMKITNFATQ